jgi:hypothetical protein
MNRTLIRLAVFALLAPGWGLAQMASAQTTPPKSISLTAADAARIKSIKLFSAIPQDDIKTPTERFIRTQVNPTPAYGGGGILGAIIGAVIADAIINSQIKARLEQIALAWPTIVESVADYDFRAEFWSELEKLQKADLRFRIADRQYFRGERPYAQVPEAVDGVPIDAVVDLNTEYLLQAGLRTLQVTTTAVMKLRNSEKEIYRASYTFTTPPVIASNDDFQGAANRWAADGGRLYRAALRLAAQQTARMLQLDLLDAKAPLPAIAPVQLLRTGDLGREDRVFSQDIGNVIERDKDLYVVRDKSNNMRSVIAGKAFAPADLPPPTVAEGMPIIGDRPPQAPAAAPGQSQEAGVSLDSLRDLLPAQ